MAGKFTHLKYDKDAYDDAAIRNNEQINYNLDPHFANNCNKCFSTYGPIGGHGGAIVSENDKIDVDSILKGITKINTKSNRNQVPDSLRHYRTFMPQDCSNALESNYSRTSHPARELKGLAPRDMRLSYPLRDPQCNIFENFSVNTRLHSKDNHRTPWQKPLDQSSFFPPQRTSKPKQCRVTVDCNYVSS